MSTQPWQTFGGFWFSGFWFGGFRFSGFWIDSFQFDVIWVLLWRLIVSGSVLAGSVVWGQVASGCIRFCHSTFLAAVLRKWVMRRWVQWYQFGSFQIQAASVTPSRCLNPQVLPIPLTMVLPNLIWKKQRVRPLLFPIDVTIYLSNEFINVIKFKY